MAKQKILFIGDALSSLNLKTDSSIAFCESALKLNYEVLWCEKKDVSFYNYEIFINDANRIVYASTEEIKYINISEDGNQSFRFSEFDYCFIRPNPPFDESYLSLCWILNTQTKVKIINPPSALLKFHEKSLHWRAYEEGIIEEKNLIATCLTKSANQVKKFLNTHSQNGRRQFVTKPWFGHGGEDIKLWNSHEELLTFYNSKKEMLIIQPYQENIQTDGDRRVIIINGKIECSFVRLPAKNSIVANIAGGGSALLREMTHSQIMLCEKIAQFTLEHGILFAGIDLIGEKIGEINITSPTGIRLYESLSGEKITDQVFQKLVL